MNKVDNVIQKLHPIGFIKIVALLCAIVFIIPQTGNTAGVFGDGSDGDFTVASNTTLTSDKQYNNLTVNGGVTLYTNGHIIRVAGTLINNGTITDTLGGGTGGTGSNGGTGGGYISNPTSGSSGINGTGATLSGGGIGGRSGGGGGGGGSAWETTGGRWRPGGIGGKGGNGGDGGGVVTIYAQSIQNNSLIHANGFPGQGGNNGSTGGFQSWSILFIDYDHAGGGGGGGAGGNGGNGGTVDIFYDNLIATGSITANGGNGGSNGFGGNGINTNHNAYPTADENNGAIGSGGVPHGGTGGRGEVSSVGSVSGAAGQTGSSGSPGSISLLQTVDCYVDNDGDGFGAGPAIPSLSCGAGFADNDFDCDDNNSNINPDATEIVGNGIDEDCDGGDVCYVDNDTDGFGSNSTINSANIFCLDPGESDNNFDCDDNNSGINPDAIEIVGDGVDQNCDGADVCYADNDSDGFGSQSNTVNSADLDCSDAGESYNNSDCNDNNLTIYPGATEIVGDGIDQDCNGMEACYADADNDSYGSNSIIVSVDLDCFDLGESINNLDCNDINPNAYPGAVEILDNGIDEDCDGFDASCCIGIRGNIDSDISESIDISDLVMLVDFMFTGGPAPLCTIEANVDGDIGGQVDISDLVGLVDFIFTSGPPPASCP